MVSQQELRGLRAVALLGRLVREHGRQARGQQHERVERAGPGVGVRRLLGPLAGGRAGA